MGLGAGEPGYDCIVTDATSFDEIDRAIIRLLVENGRRSVVEIAERVLLSPAPVKRRIDRLERIGVIVGYTAVIDPMCFGRGFEAFTEVRFAGNVGFETIAEAASMYPEVIEVFTTAGDPDALIRLYVEDIKHLQLVIDGLRQNVAVVGTKTLIVLDRWRRGDLKYAAAPSDNKLES